MNQIHTFLKREKTYRKNWRTPCNGALFLVSVQVLVLNTFGGMYPIFNGIQAYGCIIINIIIIINWLSSILYRLCYFLTEEPNATLIDGYWQKMVALYCQVMMENKLIYMVIMSLIGLFVSFCPLLSTGPSDLC